MTEHASQAAARSSTPRERDESSTATPTLPTALDHQSLNPDSADLAQERKAHATLVARAALAGVELAKLGDGTWLASKWGLLRPLANAPEVDSFLARIGVAR